MDRSISVVIPTHNRLALLREAVWSVTSPTFDRWELIVVDDCSDDGTAEWASGLEEDRIRYVRLSDHQERSRARNVGLELARGDHVLFLDDDDKLRPDALGYLHEHLAESRDAIAAVGAREVFDERMHRRRMSHPSRIVRRCAWPEVVSGWAPGTGQWVARRAALAAAGGWDPNLVVAEDQDLWLRLARLGDVLLLPRTVIENRAHAAQWRPPDVSRVEAEVRYRMLTQLEGRDRARGARLVETWGLFKEASRSYRNSEAHRSLTCLALAFRTEPRLFVSPIVGRGLLAWGLKMFIALLIGPRATKQVSCWRAKTRRWLQRDPGGARRVAIRLGANDDISERVGGVEFPPTGRAREKPCVGRDVGWTARRVRQSRRPSDGHEQLSEPPI